MSNPNAPTIERIVLAFQQAYFEDDSNDGAKSLSHYLKLWPDHEDLIAREFLNLQNGTVESVEMRDLDADSKTLGPYSLDREIGRGGQGLVYKAIDSRLGRVVALKVLTGLGPGAEKQIIRFRREAEVAARLDHPGICGVHDAGVEDGVPYIAMRYVSGESLAQRLSRSKATSNGDNGESIGFLDLTEMGTEGDVEEIQPQGESSTDVSMTKSQLDATLRVFEKAARALHAAHEAGVIHRDVKPGNIMVTDEGEPVVLDFGLAHDDSEDMPSLTQTGDFFGTPAYMSPEQIAGQRIHLDARSDVYSLGVTLYESLVLRRPFDAPTREGLYQAIMTKDAPDPRRLNRSISKDLKIVLECVLEKDRDKRYQSALAFADDLAAVRELRPIAANPIGPIGRIVRWAKRKPVRATFAAALIIGIPLITGLAGYIFANLPNIQAQEQAALDEETEKDLERGFFESNEGDVRKGVDHFERALKRTPNSMGAAVGLAWSYLKLKEPESALRVIRKAERELPDPAVLYSLKADILKKLDRPEAAKKVRDLATPPHSAITWFMEGIRIWSDYSDNWAAKRPKEVHEGAVAMMRRAVNSSPTARRVYHITLASMIRHGASKEECTGLAEAMEELWPNEAEVFFWSGMCTEFTDPKKSVNAFLTAARLNPKNAYYIGNVGVCLNKIGEYEKALPMFQKARELDPEIASYYHFAGRAYQKLGKFEAANLEYQQAIKRAPEKANYYGSAGFVLLKLGKFADALSMYKDAILRDTEKAHYYRNAGWLHYKLGEHEESASMYMGAIRCAPEKASNYFDAGWALSRLGKFNDSLSMYNEAILRDPKHYGAHINAGIAHQELGEYDKAIPYFDTAIFLQPKNRLGHHNKANALHELERYEDAYHSYLQAINNGSRSPFCHRRIVSLLWRDARWDEAEAFVSKGLDLPLNSVTPFHLEFMTSQLLRERKFEAVHKHYGVTVARYDEAIIQAQDEKSNLSWNLAEIFRNQSTVFRDQGRPIDAEKARKTAEGHHQQAIDAAVTKEDRAKLLDRLAFRLRDNFQYPEAEKTAREAVELDPGNPTYHNNLAIKLEMAGDVKSAELSYRKAIDIKPGYEYANANLGYVLQLQEKFAQAKAAFIIARRASGDLVETMNDRVGSVLRNPKPTDKRAKRKALRQAHIAVLMTQRQDSRSLELLGKVNFFLGETEKVDEIFAETERAYRNEITLAGDDKKKAQLHRSLGRFLNYTGQQREAVLESEKATLLDPTNSSYFNTLGCNYLGLGRPEDAEAAFLNAIELDATDPWPNMNLAYIQDLRSEKEEANRRFEVTLKYKPDMVFVQNQRSREWIRGVKPRSVNANFWAHRQALYAVRMTHNKDAVSLNLLATIEFMQGKFEDAVKNQKQLVLLMDGKDVGDLKFADAEANLAKYKKAMNGEGSK
ncbi:MAG: tetratricopeptide (TPR) repeat protein [Planctomycetota bacterium]|jgi:tetratricopeptide (TPR) repeat protein